MKLELTLEVKSTIQKAFKLLKGGSRRLFMASVVVQLEKGGQRLAEKELGWNRDLIRKGVRELKSGIACVDNFSSRGCKQCEERHPLYGGEKVRPKDQTKQKKSIPHIDVCAGRMCPG